MNNAKPIILVRGLPGSGKSTFAGKLLAELADKGFDGKNFETDNFFYNKNTGNYEFDSTLLSLAHSWNEAEVYKYCRDNPDEVCIVANTFTTMAEMDPYFNIAKKLCRTLLVVEIYTKHESIHNVPEKTISKMAARFKGWGTSLVVNNDTDATECIRRIVAFCLA